jgi:hypothetical protein
MTNIVTRTSKGAPLTISELDGNFLSLESAKIKREVVSLSDISGSISLSDQFLQYFIALNGDAALSLPTVTLDGHRLFVSVKTNGHELNVNLSNVTKFDAMPVAEIRNFLFVSNTTSGKWDLVATSVDDPEPILDLYEFHITFYREALFPNYALFVGNNGFSEIMSDPFPGVFDYAEDSQRWLNESLDATDFEFYVLTTDSVTGSINTWLNFSVVSQYQFGLNVLSKVDLFITFREIADPDNSVTCSYTLPPRGEFSSGM